MPKVSVCIPIKNCALWFPVAVESIIGQSFKDWEIVAVDDCSSDDIEPIVKHFKRDLGDNFRFFRNQGPSGIAKTRNNAVMQSSGEIIVVQDADDVSHADRLKKTVAYMKRHDVDIVYGSFQYMDIFGKPFQEEKAFPFNAKKLAEHNYIAHPTVAYTKKAFISVGGYRPECMVLDDWFLYLDFIKAKKKFGMLEDVLSFYRVHGDSVSRTKDVEIRKMREKFLKEAKCVS